MKYLRWIIVVILIICLILVRKYEYQLFYDPLLAYFHGDFMNTSFPVIDIQKHLGSVILRYLLNSVISLGVIYFIFQDIRIVKFSSVLYIIFLLLMIFPYYYFIQTEFKQWVTAGFYVRRLLIQPVLLLILIPAIFYWKHQKHKAIP